MKELPDNNKGLINGKEDLLGKRGEERNALLNKMERVNKHHPIM
jgi:hypothetical protein